MPYSFISALLNRLYVLVFMILTFWGSVFNFGFLTALFLTRQKTKHKNASQERKNFNQKACRLLAFASCFVMIFYIYPEQPGSVKW